MFIIIPLSLILISLIGIFSIVYKKRSYLDKLYAINTAGNGSQSATLSGANFTWESYFGELFPEVQSAWNKLGITGYKSIWLMETEKTLRRMRLLFLRVDRWSDVLIKKIRRIHQNDQLNGRQQAQVIASTSIPESKAVSMNSLHESATGKTHKISLEFLKNEEERLIMEIARNPKDASLYESLGDLYIEMQNFIDAKNSYEAAIELNPQNGSIMQKLSSALEHVAQS